MENPLINPFKISAYSYKNYSGYIEYLKNFKQPIDFHPERFTYTETLVDDIIPETMKDDETILFSISTELDISSRNINTEINFSNTFDTDAPTEYTGAETSLNDQQYLQISSIDNVTKPINEPIYEFTRSSTSRYIFRENSKPIPVSHKTNLSKPMKSIKLINNIKKPIGRPSVYDDDEVRKNRREYAAYKKQLIYKSLTFPDMLNLYGKLVQTKFYSKFENWLDANKIVDLETIKIYDSEYKLYRRNIISE